MKQSQIDEITANTKEINTLETKINILKGKEKQIELNNDKILLLEKKMIKLPESLMAMVTDSIDNLYDEYTCSLENWVDELVCGKGKTNIDTILQSTEYKEYETNATQYFLSKEISQYKMANDQTEETIINEQSSLEDENIKIKSEIKTIKTIEMQIRQLESKNANIKIKIQQIENDMANLEGNKKIDDEIVLIKQKKDKYQKRISDMEQKNSQIRKQNMQIAKYEQLQNEKIYIDKDLKTAREILEKFELYKSQIENNAQVQKDLYALKAELADFEEVIDEVEKQYNIENTNLTKNIALLDQIRKDIADNKAIENNLTLFTIYRKALKQLPYLLLAKIQPFLEKKVNDLLSIITDFTLKFDMSDSKIDIYIDRSIYSQRGETKGIRPDRHILVNNASGFERFISSLAIRLALLDISNLPKLNFMAIDEGWSCFDTTNLNNVGQILDYLKTKFDFILTISHLSEIKQYCDKMIGLKKDDKGFSKIIV